MKPAVKGRWRRACAIAVLLGAPAAAGATSADVLVVYSQNRLLPASVQFDRGLNPPAERWRPNARLRFFTEFLDHPDFTGLAYETRTARYLGQKYAARKPRLIVAVGYVALTFLLRFRQQMFPGVRIVHAGVDRDFLNSAVGLRAGLTGIPVDYDVAGTIELARRLHPKARRLVVVTGAAPWAEDRLADVRDALAQSKPGLQVQYWSHLSTDVLLRRLRALDAGTIVYTPGYFRDGAGQSYAPRESVRLMAANSGAPIYTVVPSHIGSGVVGGRMSTFIDMGRATRMLIDDILEASDSAPSVALPALPAPAQLDWRQLRKWDVSMDRVPPDALLRYRTPTFWELYRSQALMGAPVVLGQAGLIVALLFERRRHQRTANALAASQERMRVAAKAARLSMFIWDMAGTSPGHAGWRNPAPPGRGEARGFDAVIEQAHPGDRERLRVAAQRTLEHGEDLDTEFRTVADDGGVRWFAARGHLGRGDQLTGVVMDISERKAAELQAAQDRAALAHLARVSTMSQLSAAIAHQINQPLTSILSNAEVAQKMLGRAVAPVDALQEILGDVIAEQGRAVGIIRQLTALYRRGPAERASFQMNGLVRETLELVHAEVAGRQVSTRLALGVAMSPVEGSRIQLQQVLLNLVMNAMDAMAEIPAPDRILEIRTSQAGAQIEVSVCDRGKGMGPEALERVFAPFWTTKPNGVGVGLAISRAVVEAHGGTLVAGNRPDGGASFRISLPLPATNPCK